MWTGPLVHLGRWAEVVDHQSLSADNSSRSAASLRLAASARACAAVNSWPSPPSSHTIRAGSGVIPAGASQRSRRIRMRSVCPTVNDGISWTAISLVCRTNPCGSMGCALVHQGRLDPQIGWRGEWERAAEAAEAISARRVNGKAVLDVR